VIEDEQSVYIVTDFMPTNLKKALEVPSNRQHFASDIRYTKHIVLQLLKGLVHIHSLGLIHRDLKPDNILINERAEIAICDFGLTRTCDTEECMTDYTVTRWWRPPEILLGGSKYSTAVDMWSLGIILSQLLLQKMLFNGSSTHDQTDKIFSVLGKPSVQELLDMDIPKDVLRWNPLLWKPYVRNFDSVFSQVDPLAKDLMSKLLCMSPKKRITAEQAMQHPFFTAK
jgi:serine/threonine protein kinase